MPSPSEDRLRVAAIITALKSSGIRVKNWKNFLNSAIERDDTPQQDSQYSFGFGRDLLSLPQCHVSEMGGAVPRFLVDACEFLSLHLHTEGLFRKTGSLSRIRGLRAAFEQGDTVFCPPLSAALQPCDVATVLKQFLRELPSPLIPFELQGPLCRARGLGSEGFGEGGRDGATLLVTALFPPAHSRALRYFCTFLRRTAERCNENRMEVGSLALVIAPNLLQFPAGGSKMTVGTEKLLDRQAEVITTLITHADRIGMVPAVIMDALSTTAEPGVATPSTDGVGFQKRAGLSVYRSSRRHRRRSVGEMFVDALSKLKTARTPTGHSLASDSMLDQPISPAPQSPLTTKRKATEDSIPEIEGSAKKRRSIHDLREDNQPISLSCSDESESTTSQSPTPSLSSVLSGSEGSGEQEILAPFNTSGKKNNGRNDSKRLPRHPAQENGVQRRRRRSLRFFTLTNWSSPSTDVPADCDAGGWLLDRKKVTGSVDKYGASQADVHFGIPVILIESPGRVVVGSEMESDPDLLNCSFAEDPHTFLNCDAPLAPTEKLRSEVQPEDAGTETETVAGDDLAGERKCEAVGGTERCRTLGNSEAAMQPNAKGGQCDEREDALNGDLGEHWQGEGILSRVSPSFRPPRRSISLPDVTAEHVESRGEVEEGCHEDSHEVAWSEVDDAKGGLNKVKVNSTGVEKGHVEAADEERSDVEPGGEMKTERAEQKEEDELGAGFKRSHQRMSVADRVRRFNMLSAWLRAPRAPPFLPAFQQSDALHETQWTGGPRGAVRLRRQGARRFSRSISHEGVSALLLDQNVATQQQKHNKLSQHWPPPQPQSSPPELTQPHLQQHQERLPKNHLQEQREHPGLLQKSEWLQHLHQNQSKEQSWELGVPQHQPVLQKQQKPKGLERHGKLLQEPDLHELLELKLQLHHPELRYRKEPAVWLKSQDPLHMRSVSLQQDPLEIVRPTYHLSAPRAMHHHTSQAPLPDSDDCCSPQMDSQSDCSLQNDTTFDHLPLLPSDLLLETRPERNEICSSTSPPAALDFTAPTPRRRYRDSPRWPIPEIRIATWNPLQL